MYFASLCIQRPIQILASFSPVSFSHFLESQACLLPCAQKWSFHLLLSSTTVDCPLHLPCGSSLIHCPEHTVQGHAQSALQEGPDTTPCPSSVTAPELCCSQCRCEENARVLRAVSHCVTWADFLRAGHTVCACHFTGLSPRHSGLRRDIPLLHAPLPPHIICALLLSSLTVPCMQLTPG